MKKLLLFSMLTLGAASVSMAQSSTSAMETTTGPIMKFDMMEHDFGKIEQGKSVTWEFRFKNVGKEPLIINNAVGSCGCTVPDWPKEPIKPGGYSIIRVTFNSAGKMGPQDKTVTITYDTDKTVVLHMKGEVFAKPADGAPATNGTAQPAATGTTAQPKAAEPAKAPVSKPKQTTAPAAERPKY
jgi:hypothetical protein